MKFLVLIVLGLYLVAGVLGCVEAFSSVPKGDACVTACEHRLALRCLEPDLAPQCEPACNLATRRGWFDPIGVSRATREEMPSFGVRCLP